MTWKSVLGAIIDSNRLWILISIYGIMKTFIALSTEGQQMIIDRSFPQNLTKVMLTSLAVASELRSLDHSSNWSAEFENDDPMQDQNGSEITCGLMPDHSWTEIIRTV